MTGTGVFTAVERAPKRINPRLGTQGRRAGPALGCVMILTLLLCSGVSAVEVLNPSFETTTGTYYRPLPKDWWKVDDPSCFNSYCSKTWKTDGTWSAGLFSLMKKAVSRGKYENFFQESVDLTGIATIKFDVQLAVLPYGGTFEHFEASFLVDGVPLWSRNVGGVYLDQEVNVAGMGAWRTVNGHPLYGHKIEMRITALDTGTFAQAYWTQWDNIRLIEGEVIIPAVVDLDPSTLNLASNGNWITCYIELGEDDSGKTYDVNTIGGATVTLNNNDHAVPAYLGNQGWATAAANAENVADYDGDGILERMVKFDRAAVQGIVQPPQTEVSIKGKLTNGTLFEGTTTIRVLDNKAKTP